MAIAVSYTIATGASVTPVINTGGYLQLLIDLPTLAPYFAASSQKIQILGCDTETGTYLPIARWDGNATWIDASGNYTFDTVGGQIIQFPGPLPKFSKISFENVTTADLIIKVHFIGHFQ